MSIGKIDTFYGLHSFSAINRTSKQLYGSDTTGKGIIKVLKSAALNTNMTLNELTGGSYAGAVATERGASNFELSIKLAEYPSWLFALAGYVVTSAAAEASGAVTTPANQFGTSVFSATTGIASSSITTEADIKAGRYLIVAVSTTTVDVYAVTDIDFKGNGTSLDYQNNALKITASALTITTTTAVAVPGIGISLTGGSGTIGMTVGDVASFEIRKANLGSEVITMPASPVPVEFEAVLYKQKQSDGDMQAIVCPRCIFSAFPLPGDEKAFSESDITIKVLLDEVNDKFFDIKRVRAV